MIRNVIVEEGRGHSLYEEAIIRVASP